MDNDGAGDEPAPTPPAEETPATAAPPTGGIAVAQGTLSEKDDKLFGMLAHILGAITNFLGPLIIWAIKKDESPFVNDQGKEALNFQITLAIGHVVSMILGAVTGGCASLIISPAVWLVSVIFGIIGGMEANKGVVYRYPFALRLIK